MLVGFLPGKATLAALGALSPGEAVLSEDVGGRDVYDLRLP
jgi:hypothetical protein